MGIERYRSQSVRIASEVSREKKADIIPQLADVRQSQEGSHWNPLGEGN